MCPATNERTQGSKLTRNAAVVLNAGAGQWCTLPGSGTMPAPGRPKPGRRHPGQPGGSAAAPSVRCITPSPPPWVDLPGLPTLRCSTGRCSSLCSASPAGAPPAAGFPRAWPPRPAFSQERMCCVEHTALGRDPSLPLGAAARFAGRGMPSPLSAGAWGPLGGRSSRVGVAIAPSLFSMFHVPV